MNLTPKQLEVLKRVAEYRAEQGYSPTMQELADHLGVSKVTVFERVESLVRKGALEREPNKARSLSIAENVRIPGTSPTQVPLAGRIAAGHPIERCEDNAYLDIEAFFGPRIGQRGNTFALQVEGDSMRDEGILDGDYVLVEQRANARDGERVVALLPDGETTLKTFFREGARFRLQPANPAFDPIVVDDCQNQGIVMGVMRRYRRSASRVVRRLVPPQATPRTSSTSPIHPWPVARSTPRDAALSSGPEMPRQSRARCSTAIRAVIRGPQAGGTDSC